MKVWATTVGCVLAMPVMALFAAVIFFEPELWRKLVFAAFWAWAFLGLLHGAISVHVHRTLLLLDRVEERKLFGVHTLARVDVTGIRRGENGLILCSRHGEKQDFEVTLKVLSNPAWVAWLNTLKNLDVEKALAEEAKLEADARFGETVERRRETLSSLRRADRWLMLLTLGIMVWVFFWPRPYELAISVMAIAPLAIAAIYLRWRSIFSVVEAPFVFALMVAIFIAFRATLDIQIFDAWPGYAAAGGLASLVALIVIRFSREDQWWKTILAAAVVGIPVYLWVWGSISFANVLLDSGKPMLVRATVIERIREKDKGPVVTVRTRTPDGDLFRNVKLTKEHFAASAPGAVVCLEMFPGRLGWRWGDIIDCPTVKPSGKAAPK